MQAADLLSNNPNPSDQEIVGAMSGNLCRCMTYDRIQSVMEDGMTKHYKPEVSRRAFLIGAGSATTVLTMGYTVLPIGVSPAEAAGNNMFSPSMLFDMHADGRVVVNVSKWEMGQHVGTALAQILADELECEWDKTELNHIGFDPAFGLHVTGGSWSVNWSFDAMSRAGAAGRKALIEAAMTRFGGAASEYTAKNGVVSGRGNSITYDELVAGGIEPRTMGEPATIQFRCKHDEIHTCNYEIFSAPAL